MLTREEIEVGLNQFAGSSSYTIHQPGLVLTDGAEWLAESAECYWLYDIIGSSIDLRTRGFARLTLTVNLPLRRGMVVIDDGSVRFASGKLRRKTIWRVPNDNPLYTQRIPYTDFPLPEVKLFIADAEGRDGWGKKVILLPAEY